LAKYKPEWEKYYTGGAGTVQQFNYHAGKCVLVDFDGDYQSWTYRTDLFEDPTEQKNFKAQYGWDLQWPETWEQFDQIAQFFNRPDKGLVGSTDLRNPSGRRCTSISASAAWPILTRCCSTLLRPSLKSTRLRVSRRCSGWLTR